MTNLPWSATNESEITLVPGLPDSSSNANETVTSRNGLWEIPPLPRILTTGNPTLLVNRLRIGLDNNANTDPRYTRPSDPRLDGGQLFGPEVDWVPRYVVNALLEMYESGVTDPNVILSTLQGPPEPLPQLTYAGVCHAAKTIETTSTPENQHRQLSHQK